MTAGILIFSYLLGSIPNGLIFGKLIWHKDLRNFGSHNIGATNAWRVIGAKAGILIFLLDFLKGAVSVALAKIFVGDAWVMVLAGLLAILGHTFSIFLKLRGGKGVATGLGVIALMMPKKSFCWSGRISFRFFLRSSVVSERIIFWKEESLGSSKNMCSVRHRPIPAAPKRNAWGASFCSAFARTSNPLTLFPEAVTRLEEARTSSAQPRKVSRSPETEAGVTGMASPYTFPVEPSMEMISPLTNFLPPIVISSFPVNTTSEHPQTQGVPIPRATTAA